MRFVCRQWLNRSSTMNNKYVHIKKYTENKTYKKKSAASSSSSSSVAPSILIEIPVNGIVRCSTHKSACAWFAQCNNNNNNIYTHAHTGFKCKLASISSCQNRKLNMTHTKSDSGINFNANDSYHWCVSLLLIFLCRIILVFVLLLYFVLLLFFRIYTLNQLCVFFSILCAFCAD